MTTESFIEWLVSYDRNKSGILKVMNLDLDWKELAGDLEEQSFKVVKSRNGLHSVVSSANDDKNPLPISGCLEFHTDGLYCDRVPDLVLMYCEDPGQRPNGTLVSDTRAVVEKLRGQNLLEAFSQVSFMYRFGDKKTADIPLITPHPFTGEPVIQFSTGGTATASRQEPVAAGTAYNEIVRNMDVVYRLFEDAVVLKHEWRAKDLLIFDNHSFVHRRQYNVQDTNRKLIRTWLNDDRA